ncbi:RmlC-like cupin domain-containing protein [Amanita rubescens]|nr:RmlC-like cupin domain-containing protein [Amanita rubescens]KAF8344710.1 RmlC-like cupin domain-containing protein [Amanita rubescens]
MFRGQIISCVFAVLLAGHACAAPASSNDRSPSPTTKAAAASYTGPKISTDPNYPLFNAASSNPEPKRGNLGANVLGPQNLPIELQNSDALAPPTTDHGTIPNPKWSFSLSSNRLANGGWARQQNVASMPIATQMAGVNMRLIPGSIRELHWHNTGEWAYVLKGSVQVSAVDPKGRNYVATVNQGDLWYFPAGIPHSLQATNADPSGSEFLLIFDSGDFSEDSTFLLTDWLAHVPAEVIAKNFGTDIQTWANIPANELYIFPANLPEPDSAAPQSPQGTVENPFSFPLSQVKPTQLAGGTVKVVDSTTFKASVTVAAAEVTIQPGGMRQGQGRMTIFASQSAAKTFDYQVGHYVENTGNTTLVYLEIFKSENIRQWLALTPPEVVKAHLGIPDATVALLSKTKQTVVGPDRNL